MTQKIMSTVRGEYARKSLVRRLFFPLHIKLPIEAFGVVLLALTAVFVYNAMQPVDLFSEKSAPVFDQAAAPKLKQKEGSKDKASPGTTGVPQRPEYKALDMKPAYAPPAPPTLEEELPAPSTQGEQREAAKKEGSVGQRFAQPHPPQPRILRDESAAASKGAQAEQETPRTRSTAPAQGSLERNQARRADVIVAVRSIQDAAARVERVVKELGGWTLEKDEVPGGLELSLKLPPDRRPQLMDLLKELGKVQVTGEKEGELLTLLLAKE
jgi:hypothetical protein